MRPEMELVAHCGRIRMDAARAARVRELAAGSVDWREVLVHSLYHGLLPMVGRHLEAHGREFMPEQALVSMRTQLRENATGSLHKFSELLRVASALSAEGIPCVHFKGPILAHRAFGDVALRSFADLDVLVPERDARRARDVLLGCGFASTLSPEGEELHLNSSYWLGFRHASGLYKLDLHWKLADPFFRYEPDVDTLWANAQTVTVSGQDVLTFGAEDTVLVLAAHGFKHAYSRTKWICDLAEWIRMCMAEPGGLDWDAVHAAAAELHVERILAVSLGLVQMYDAEILPADVAARATADAQAMRLVQEIWGALFYGERAIDGVRAELFHARGRERRRDRWNYLRNQAGRRMRRAVRPNAKDRAVLPLPTGTRWLYYGVRPLRLAYRFCARRGPDTSD